jgi:hypothetical protein
MSNLNNSLAKIDDELLAALLDASQFALDDKDTVKRVAA